MYRKLSLKQRQQIEQLLGEGHSQSAIARAIGVHRSTVKREIERNTVNGIYAGNEAHVRAVARKIMTSKWQVIKKQLIQSSARQRVRRCLPRISNYRFSKIEFKCRFRLPAPYKYRKDFRMEKDHPHQYRHYQYYTWKSYWEQNYRIRDLEREKRRRRWRTAEDWRNYRYTSWPVSLFNQFLGLCYQRRFNAWRRARLKRLQQERRIEGYKAIIARNLEDIRQAKQKDKALPPVWLIVFPLRTVKRSLGMLCALPPPAG